MVHITYSLVSINDEAQAVLLKSISEPSDDISMNLVELVDIDHLVVLSIVLTNATEFAAVVDFLSFNIMYT